MSSIFWARLTSQHYEVNTEFEGDSKYQFELGRELSQILLVFQPSFQEQRSMIIVLETNLQRTLVVTFIWYQNLIESSISKTFTYEKEKKRNR